jgi:hemerythrin-like domain-containing protein
VIEQGLRALDGICFVMKTGGTVPVETLARVLDFIRNFADRFHHEREETCLFPLLKELGIEEGGGALSFLRSEHETERRLLAELELAIDEYCSGNETASDRFIDAAKQFHNHLINHMQKEEAILFRLVEEILDEDVKATLMQSLAHHDTPDSDQSIERYESLAGQLEKEWAV